MAKFNKFEEIIAWQKARELVNLFYNLIENSDLKKDFTIKDQLIRSSISIMLNIAEGFGRQSNREFIKFLFYAHGSACEVQSILYICIDRKYIFEERFNEYYHKSGEISKMVSGLIKYLKERK